MTLSDAQKQSDATPEEERAIDGLKRVSKGWPESLWLFSGDGRLWIMRKGSDGQRVTTPSGGVDPDYAIERIDIENDGGDW